MEKDKFFVATVKVGGYIQQHFTIAPNAEFATKQLGEKFEIQNQGAHETLRYELLGLKEENPPKFLFGEPLIYKGSLVVVRNFFRTADGWQYEVGDAATDYRSVVSEPSLTVQSRG